MFLIRDPTHERKVQANKIRHLPPIHTRVSLLGRTGRAVVELPEGSISICLLFPEMGLKLPTQWFGERLKL